MSLQTTGFLSGAERALDGLCLTFPHCPFLGPLPISSWLIPQTLLTRLRRGLRVPLNPGSPCWLSGSTGFPTCHGPHDPSWAHCHLRPNHVSPGEATQDCGPASTQTGAAGRHSRVRVVWAQPHRSRPQGHSLPLLLRQEPRDPPFSAHPVRAASGSSPCCPESGSGACDPQ